MKNIGIHLSQLNERKNMASSNEDYEAAKIIKLEMDKLRQATYNPWIENLIAQFLQGPNPNKQQMQMQ